MVQGIPAQPTTSSVGAVGVYPEALELQALEFMWKQEEALAQIIDEELTPQGLRERHLRRLPVRVAPKRSLLPD
jgi:hypothetical protein